MHIFAQKPKETQQTKSVNSAPHRQAFPGQGHTVDTMLYLRRTTGNQATQRLLQANAEEFEAGSATTAPTPTTHDLSRMPIYAKAPTQLQTKLAVNTPGDPFEQEADRVADQVMRMPDSKLQRTCACGGECPKCQAEQGTQEHEPLQAGRARTNDGGEAVAPPIVHEVLRSRGQPLASATREFFEPRFGEDFSHVRVHTDARAAASAKAVNARAYTVGQDVVLGQGQHAPETSAGRRLLAHELTHVVRQSRDRSLHGTHLQRTCAQNSNESFYRNSPNYCRDAGFSSWLHPGEQCYREVPKRSSYWECPPGDQVCFNKSGACSNSADAVSPVESKDSDGTCNLHFVCSLGHGVADVAPWMMSFFGRHQVQCAEGCKDLPWYTKGFCLSACSGGFSH